MIKRISHGLWLDMILIQLMCFLSPRQGSGIENTQLIGKNYIQPWEILYV